MKFMFRDVTLEQLYLMHLSELATKTILTLVFAKRIPEKKNYELELSNKIYVVYATCLGDMMDENSSHGFVLERLPDFIFVDNYTDIGTNTVIAHELVHIFQRHLYFMDDLNHYEDWTEVMARELEVTLTRMIDAGKEITITRVSKSTKYIESLVDSFEDKKPMSDAELEHIDKLKNSTDNYFEDNLLKHLDMEES